MFANVKTKLKGLFKKEKKSKKENTKKADMQFYMEHIEEFKFFVKYYPVYKCIAVSVGEKEIAKLDADKPCEFRQKSDIPFRCKCEIAVGGSEIKTIKDCRECKASKKTEKE